MAKVKLELCLEVEDGKEDAIKRCEHHIDELLDLDAYPEIKSVYGVKVLIESVSTEVGSVFIPWDKIYFVSNCFDNYIYAESLEHGTKAWVKNKSTGDVRELEMIGAVRQSYYLNQYHGAVGNVGDSLRFDVAGEFATENGLVYAFFQYKR